MTFNLCAVFLSTYFLIAISETYAQTHSVFQADNSFNDKTCPYEDAEFRIRSNNPIACVRACSEHQGCSAVIFYPANNTCSGLNASISSLTSLPLPGAVYYRMVPTGGPATVQTPTSQSQTTTGIVPTTLLQTTLSTNAPPDTTSVPATTTSVPATTTAVPATTTSVPATTTSMPATTTSVPATTTSVPATTTSVPATTTSMPATTTSVPLACASVRDLVLEVPDDEMTASYSNPQWYAKYARFGDSAAWGCDIQNGQQYIQVEFAALRIVTGVRTRGGPGSYWFVRSYNLLISEDCGNYTTLDWTDGTQVFPGNVANDIVVQNSLDAPLLARCVRFRPLSWADGIGMQIGVYGCDYSSSVPAMLK